jgi:hypothetical protein
MKAIPNESLVKVLNVEGNSRQEISMSFSGSISISLLSWYLLHSAVTLRNKNLVDSFQYKFHTSYLGIHQIVLTLIIIGSM